MKKVRVLKRSILSLVLCLCLVVTPLADTGIVVSAEENGGGTTYYSQDFSGVANATDVATAPTDTSGTVLEITDRGEGNKCLSFSLSGAAKDFGTKMTFANIADTGTKYIVEFDALIAGNTNDSFLTVMSSDFVNASKNVNWGPDTGYLFNLAGGKSNSNVYTINGGETVSLESTQWYHYKLYVDQEKGQVSTTITNAEGTVVGNIDKYITSYSSTKGDVTGLYMRPGKSYGKVQVDNVVVRAPEDSDEFGVAEKAMVSYDLQGHGDAINGEECIVGGKVTKPTAPRAEGLVFVGWYKEAGCENAWDFATENVPSGGMTLYAKWIDDPAESYSGALYAQTFSNVVDVAAAGITFHTSDVIGDLIAADETHGYYLSYNIASSAGGNRWVNLNFPSLDVSGTNSYTVEFDAAVTPGNDVNKTSTFTVNTSDGYLLSLETNGRTGIYKYTGTEDTVTIPVGEWCHYLLEVNKSTKKADLTITGSVTGAITDKKSITYTGDGNVTGLKMDQGRYPSLFLLDNIVVQAAAAPELPDGTEYYVTADVSGNETVVDCSSLINNEYVKKYRVTTTNSGAIVKQEFVDPAASVTVDTTGADKVEITPVFYYNIGAPGKLGVEGAGYAISAPAGSYDFRIVNTAGKRCDVYADEQMLVNNILQDGSTPNYFDVKDIVTSGDSITITTAENQNDDASAMKIEIYMVPSSKTAARLQKVYVLGDSLVAKYYNGGNKENNLKTGWGQVLADYLTDDVDVVDLANSGVTAKGLSTTAITQIQASAQTGDILILESGYNDRTYDTTDEMDAAVDLMVNIAKNKGVTIFLVSPNASAKHLAATVSWGSRMNDAATRNSTHFIDLTKLSYDFLSSTYGTDTDTIYENYNLLAAGDNLHSSYHGANKWASLIAGALYENDATKSIVDTDYVYAFADTKGNIISCSATGKLAEGYSKVTYSANGKGTDTFKVVENGSLLTAPAEPTASGFVFVGWYKDAEGTDAWNFDTDTVSADTILYAKWNELAAGTIYTQDFSKVTDASTVATSTNAQSQLIIKQDTSHGNYLEYDFSATKTNNRGAYMNFDGADVSQKEKYVVEFDAAIKPGTEKAMYFTVKGTDFKYESNNIDWGAASGYLLNLMGGPGTTYTMNKTETVTIPSGEWCHYKLYVDKTTQLVSTTITGSDSGSIADKVITAYDGAGDVAGLYLLAGRYYPVMAVDNILVREVAEGVDEFGEIKVETLFDAEFTTQLNTVITQPADGAPFQRGLTVKAKGSLGGDLTDKVSVAWSVVGLEKEDGYTSLTQAPGTGLGTDGARADVASYTGATAYFNVRNGVSNYYGYVQAVVTYGEDSVTIITPFAITGASASDDKQLAPATGYPVNMNDYADSLIGYKGTAMDVKSQDIVLNNWSIYGSNGARTMTLVKDADGTKSLEFASNGGGGSTVAVYQWTDQTSQYVIDFTAKFTNSMAFGVYFNTPNNTGNNPEWTASYGGGALTFGTESISGINANEWYRFVISADPSIQKASIAVYKGDAKVGEIEDIDMTNNDSVQKYFCFSGTWPMYLNSFKAYKPVTATVTVGSDKDVVKVPETGEADSTVSLSAAVTSTEGIKMTGAVQWSLADEYANVELETTGAQTATLKISEGASGAVTVIASKDGKRAEREIMLTTSSNVVAFKKSSSSITIPFSGEQAVTAEFSAETRDKDGNSIDGGAITYALLAKDGVTETTVKGVTFENGVLTVQPGASPAVVYVKAANADGLTAKVKVNIHGLSFAFGSQDAEEGYTQVTDTLYTDKLGYGFADISGLTVNTDNVTGQQAFRFKAKVPNGNYVVRVDTTAASMTSEVVENVSANTGIPKSGGSFSVAVCDGVLDLTFPAASNVKSIVISQAAAKTALAKPYVYAIGDSTTNNVVVEKGQKSWGNCVSEGLVQIPEVFGGFANHGKAGDDSVVYYNNARLEAVLLAICPGDYVTVNMGINTREAGEAASFETMIRDYYVKGIIQRGGIPVIVTATPDGPVGDRVDVNYDASTGKFTNNRGNGAKNDILRRIASELDVELIELGQWGQDWMNTLTADDVKQYNAAYMTNYKTVLEMVQSWYSDHNHYGEYLGKQIGWYLLGELAVMAGGEASERPALPEPVGGSIIEDFETTTDWGLEGKLAGKFTVKEDGKGGHYLVGDGSEIGTGNAYAKKVFADLPDMETAEVAVDWIASSAELKTGDKQSYYALQLWSGESELVSLYVSDLRGNTPAKLYYSTTGIAEKKDTGVTFKQGQTLKVKYALNFASHTLSIYLDGTEVASGVSFDALTTKVDTFAIATLDDTAAKKKYPNFAVDNFSLTYLNSKGPQDLSKLVKSVKPMAEREHSKVSNLSEFVHPTKATVVLGDGTELEVDINAATWSVDKAVNFEELGTYTWTAALIMPEGYSNPNNVKASYVMNYLADFLTTDIDALDPISVVTLTKAEYEAGYSHPQKVMAKLVSGKKVAIEIDQSTWTCEPAFNPSVRGIYVWTAQLKSNGTNGNPRNLKVSYTMHYQADWVSTHDFEEDFLFGYTGWDVWGKDIDATSGTGGFGYELKKDGDNPYLYATQADSGKNRGSRLNLPTDIVKGATMEFDFMPAVVNGGHVDLLFVAPAYKQNYLSLFVGADGKVSYHTTEDLAGSGGHPVNNTFDGVISSASPVDTGVGSIGKWTHFKLTFDYLAHTATLTVTSKENPSETYTVSDIPIDDRANGLSIMVLRKLSGCSRAEVAFDNVIVDYEKFTAQDIVKLTQPKDVNVAESEFDEFVFPAEVEATLGDNSTVMVPVGEWTATPEFERGVPGTYVWTAEIKNEELGLTNYFDLSLSFTMTYTMLPFPVYVYNPNTLELEFGEAWSGQLPSEVDAKMSNGNSGKVQVGQWTAIREFNAGEEGIYVYGANVVSVDGEYDVLADKLTANENTEYNSKGEKLPPIRDDGDQYIYNVYYRISYFKDENDNYNGYARTMENLDRGVYAVAVNGGVFVSWRLLATEYGTDKNVSFDVYRNGAKVNEAPVTNKTNLVDAAGKAGDVYTVVKTQDGKTYEGAQATASAQNYLSIPVQKPEPQQDKDGNLVSYTLNDMGVGDVDGDGEYEYIVKWYPDDAFDSGMAGGPSAPTIFDLYELDGTPLWRLNLGLELPSGAHFNQFMLYDLNEDGKAELFIKTSDGTVSYKPNAEGKFDMEDESTIVSYIGDRNVKPGTNVNSNGHVNGNSNEFVTVFNGLTGEEIDTIDYVNTTGEFIDWGTTGGGGEDGGNRSARYNIAIAYLPKTAGGTETIPAVLLNRGYYAKTTVAAYTLRDGKLQLEWNFVRQNNENEAGKGNHNMSTGDIDKDGFDELIIGALAIDHDGSVLWVKDGKEGQDFAAHADTIHLAAMNPYSNDLYVFTPNEEADHATMNAAVVNARTGARISGSWFTRKDVGRAIAANITPLPGYEYWSASTGSGIYAFDGSTISDTIPVPMNWRLYWDGDLLSELGDGIATDDDWAITKYDWVNNKVDTLATLEGTKTNNSTKKTPGLTADLFGDWREEVMLRNDDDTEIRIYMTTEETDYMIYTLMHDPVYRNAVANQNTSYNQPPHVGFYLGADNADTVLAMGLPTAEIKYGVSKEEKVTVAEPLADVPEPTEEIKQKTGCTTAEELKSYLKRDVISRIKSIFNAVIPAQNTAVQEIVVKISLDGGRTFEPATADNFPKEGVKIVLPYPEGTNRAEYNFAVSHLITMNCNGLQAGDVVNETVTKTDAGLEMIIKSASPFVIGWYKIGSEQPEQPEQPVTPEPGQDDDDEDDEDVVNTSDDRVSIPAKTGDRMGTLLWLCIALIIAAAAGIGATVFVRYRKKQ